MLKVYLLTLVFLIVSPCWSMNTDGDLRILPSYLIQRYAGTATIANISVTHVYMQQNEADRLSPNLRASTLQFVISSEDAKRLLKKEEIKGSSMGNILIKYLNATLVPEIQFWKVGEIPLSKERIFCTFHNVNLDVSRTFEEDSVLLPEDYPHSFFETWNNFRDNVARRYF